MTAHELANKLLEGPDLPVTAPYGGEGDRWEVTEVKEANEFFLSDLKSGDGPHIHLS